MSDDLNYVRERIADYGGYDDERARHDTDMRVRAFVGERLSKARARFEGTLDEATIKVIDDVLMRCMFSDQVFVRKFEHARLDESMTAALIKSDRDLIELAEGLPAIDASAIKDHAIEIDKEFEYRRSPEPLSAANASRTQATS